LSPLRHSSWLIGAFLLALIQVPRAQSLGAVSISFVGSGAAMGAAESAGVIAKTRWNNASGAARSTPLALVDETGAVTTATVAWTATGVWSLPITDQAGNRRMMRGYLDTTATSSTTVTVAGLPVGAYDVYVYADGDNGSAMRSASYRISGAGIAAATISLTDAANTNFNAAFTPANASNGNYVKFSVTASGFTLTATPGAAANYPRAPLNGIQIVPQLGASGVVGQRQPGRHHQERLVPCGGGHYFRAGDERRQQPIDWGTADRMLQWRPDDAHHHRRRDCPPVDRRRNL
jgi:hypothetical protein